MAYKSKYYDPVKAHEYYEKHKQLKGRTKKTSIADLSDAGKVAAKEVKEQLQAELKAALKKVKKGNTAERKRLRELYQQKYIAELEQIRQDPSMVKAAKQKATKQPKQAKQKAAKSSGGSSKSSKGSTTSGGSGKTTKASQTTTPSTQEEAKTEAKEEPKQPQTESERVTTMISQLRDKIGNMNEEQKKKAKELITKLVDYYKQLVVGG